MELNRHLDGVSEVISRKRSLVVSANLSSNMIFGSFNPNVDWGKVEDLDLSSNQITGTLYGATNHFLKLDLSSNTIEAISPDFGEKCPNMQQL